MEKVIYHISPADNLNLLIAQHTTSLIIIWSWQHTHLLTGSLCCEIWSISYSSDVDRIYIHSLESYSLLSRQWWWWYMKWRFQLHRSWKK